MHSHTNPQTLHLPYNKEKSPRAVKARQDFKQPWSFLHIILLLQHGGVQLFCFPDPVSRHQYLRPYNILSTALLGVRGRGLGSRSAQDRTQLWKGQGKELDRVIVATLIPGTTSGRGKILLCRASSTHRQNFPRKVFIPLSVVIFTFK